MTKLYALSEVEPGHAVRALLADRAAAAARFDWSRITSGFWAAAGVQ